LGTLRDDDDAQGEPRIHRLLHFPRRLLAPWLDDEESSFAFGVRLSSALAVTLILVGAVAYVEIDHRLQRRTIDNYAEAQRADVRGFENVVAHSAPRRAPSIRSIACSTPSRGGPAPKRRC
jgi:hypothetical protein